MSGPGDPRGADSPGGGPDRAPGADPGPVTPPSRGDTDEFGRADEASLERERRRREREQRRRGGGGTGKGRRAKRTSAPREGGGLLGRLRRGDPPPGEEAAPAPEAAPRRAARRDAPPAEGGSRSGAPVDRSKGGGGSYRRRRVVAIVGGLLGLLLIWFLVALFQPFAGDGLGSGRVAVKIPEGASAGQVADLLAEKGVISNSTLFQIRLKLSGKSDQLVSGELAMASGMSYGAAIDRLTGATSEAGRLVIPEGYSRDQVAPLVEKAGISGDYLAKSKAYKGFDPNKYGASNPKSLEGFLFPATYDLTPKETAGDLVGQQLAAFKANLKKVDLSYAKKKGNLTPYDVLTIASMIDREVVVPKERPLVSAVIWNRLHDGIPLGIDATARFEFKNYTKPLTDNQLHADSPYNTRDRAGLPPTPIGNPGLASIKAAARPASVNYLYYVVDPNSCNGHSFTASEKEFERLVAKYNKARAANGGAAPSNC